MTYSFKQSINLTLPILLVLLLGTPTQATASIDTTALVGSTAAGFSVNQGTANYTIPITVPPGIADMQPKLSINYNSNVGNGQLGVGFSLSGLSAIHRCAKTIVTDGIKGGVNYNNNDRYCLNGQRLIAISGVDGQSGSKYRTEINSFSKIKYNGNYWTVKTKSGQTFEYGNTQNSKIEAQGKSTVRLWAVNKITDVANNAINYIYNEDNVNGEYTLNSIDYANSSINLTYEDRNDVPTSYQAGSKLQQTKRLSNITTHVNNNIVRTYDLEYQYQGAPERSQLTSIEECVDNVCLPKISFLQSNPLTDNNIFKYIGTHGGSGESNTKFYFGDFNGDGMTDYVYHNTSYNDGKFKINLNTTKNSKVQTITNGFNIQTTINYKPLTDNTVYTKGSNGSYPNIDTQNARQVVSSVTTDNAIGSQNTTTYKYGGAKVNVKGRGNLGFAWIEKKDLQTNKLARTEYSQTYPYIGQITSTKEYIETNNSRQLLNSQTNIHQDKSSYSNKIHAPYSSQSLEKSYDLNSGNLLTTITTQQSNIDNYGNVGTIKVTTTGKNKTFIKTTRNTYNNNATKWHLGRLTASTVTHQAPNIPNIIRTSRFAYNNKGLLKSETIEPNTKKALTTTYNYDSFGNKIKATTSASGIASRSTTTEYSANGKFPIKATNALGHSETKTFDAKTGNILTLTGPNNLTTTWQYDTLGRKKLETRADSTTTSTNYQWAEDESPNSLYKITTTTSGSSPKTTYFDAFNRKVREQHTGFDGRKINSDTYYDNLGRVDRASLPYFTDEQGYFITTQYDAIGRLISSTKPADYGNTATNSTAYNGLTTINTNALGYQKTTTKNAIGKIIRIDEPESAWLTHQHDAIGNLTQTNVGGVTTTMTYDNRGNKISMNDPDMGRWTYTYNALGELINQTDAKNQTSTTSYDKLGRMTQRVEPEGTTNWQYDTKTNGIGKLAKVTALPDYKKEYSYDSLGRIGTTTTHVNNQSFNIQNQYDQYSRLSTQTRPQNFKVENVYNQYGYLMAKRAPKDQISDYDWEHLTKLTQDSLVNVEEALTKANEFEQKANVYRFVAKGYRQYADDATNISAEFTQKAQELRNNADLLEEVVVRLQKEAKQYTDSAKGYLIAARRFQHLSNVNVADDQERSYIDSNTNSKIGGYGFYSGGSIAAQSNTNGYAWCSNQAACVYWANASKQYAIINTNQAKQKLELAQRYINSSGVEKQAFANQEADNYDKKANDYTRYAVNYIDLSNEYLEQAQESVNQAKYWRGVAANAPDYQAMLADTNNIYFWRAKSRDASGRLTGHIVGNGLSTEQQYSPATGHLFAIKSGFGNTDGIRSLEYEYDLMNNVTQRQNHQSGLTEDFQYDELDRLTQSNTTGNIEGVTYNNGTSYQYDINGNITHKSDIGYYRYNPQRPHAIASINSNSPSSTDDYNANTATTGMLTINSSVTGNIETGNDTDWFKITLTAGQQVTFDLEGKPTQSGTLPDPYLRGIYNNTGTLISNTTNDDSGIGVNSKVIFTASTSNTYYISAGAYSRNTGTYTLTAIVTGSGASITPSLSDDYIYDANGNMTKNNNKIIQWTSFNKPKRFTKSNSNDNTTFVYAPNRSRYQKTQTKASSNTTIATTYIGKLYEQIKQNTSTEHKHFIYADGQLIAINIKTDTTTGTPSIPDKTRYLHYDNLGSIDTITNGQGNIVERMAYTAFGQRRQGDWRASDPLLPIIPALTNRGFTGHEHIDEMGFIHMNGRVYDPSIGRFLSVDSTVPYIFKSQSYNRYSYTRNNPLKYKDPSGYYDYNDDWDDDWSDDWDNDWDDDWDNDWDDDYNDWGNDWGSSRNASHVQSNYKITGTANSNDSLSKGGILLDDFTTLKPKNWKQEKTIYDGGSYNFNGGRYLKLESRSNTLGFDPFRYIAKGYPLEVDGSLGSTISGLNWGHYTSSGGLGMGSVRVIDSGLYNQYDTHWVVKIPLQPSTNDNSSGHYINIYHSD